MEPLRKEEFEPEPKRTSKPNGVTNSTRLSKNGNALRKKPAASQDGSGTSGGKGAGRSKDSTAVVVPIASASEHLLQDNVVPFPVAEPRENLGGCRTDPASLAPQELPASEPGEVIAIPPCAVWTDSNIPLAETQPAGIPNANFSTGVEDRRPAERVHPLLARFGKDAEPKFDVWGRLLAAEMDQLQSEQAGSFAKLRPKFGRFIDDDIKTILATIGSQIDLREARQRYGLLGGLLLALLIGGYGWWERLAH